MLSFIVEIVLAILIVSVLSFIVFKVYSSVTVRTCKSTNRLVGKVVIITDANTDLGKEVAVDLAQRGARIILACRDSKIAENTKGEIVSRCDNKNVVVYELDLSSFKSVRKFAEIIRTSEAKIDILINNAECIVQGEIFTEDGLEYQMQTNYFSHFLLTHLLLGKMLKTEGSKIINVSSSHHSLCRKLDLSSVNFTRQTTNRKEIEVYCASKLCQILFTKELAHRIKSSGKLMAVNVANPGLIPTEMSHDCSAFHGLLCTDAQRLFHTKTPKEGAQTVIHLAVADEVAHVTGEYFSDCQVVKPSKLAQDEEMARKVWFVSKKLVDLKPDEILC